MLHHRACTLCEAICGIVVETEGDRIVSIRGDDEDPLSRGHICPKAVALKDLHSDPDRLKRPLRRVGEDWLEIPWDEAFDLTARRLRQVQAEHGRDAVAVYLGNPTVHNSGSMLFGPPFLKALGTKSRFSATSVDQLPHHVVAWWLFGHQLLLPVPDVDRTDFFLILGANPLASNGSLMTAPGMRRRLQAIQARDGRVVVVDPRRTETARRADVHLPIRPGTDALFLLALLHVVFDEGWVSPGRLAGFLDGLDALRRAAEPFSPERIAEATGLAAKDVRSAARSFGEAPSAVAYGRMGCSTQEFGTLCQWLTVALNAVTGNLDRPGGAMFPEPAVDLVSRTGPGGLGRRKTRVRGLPGFGGELPVSALAEEMLTPGEGQLRALVTSAGNPVLSTPNGRRLEAALPELDFMVSIDFYLNETTRHAHVILPPTGPLEHDHYDLAFHNLAVRNTSRYSPPLFEPEPGARHDWQILSELTRRLRRHGQGWWGRSKAELTTRAVAWLGPRRLLDWGLRSGPYKLTLKRLEQEPHGIDLGPLAPRLPDVLRTENRRIDLAPELLLADLKRLEDRLVDPPSDDGAFQLIGRRQVRSNNSWMHNVPRLMRGDDRCTLLIHPDDATRLGLETNGSGEPPRVRVSSRTGTVEVPAEISDEIRRGVVSLPHGWGHDRSGTRLSVAEEHPGVSLNDVTDEQRVDPVCGNAAFSGVPVRLEPV